ncbi:hypothetical protein ANO11243_054090 [Dothideomycetidae sp. 11243]|nr:hypothetical protein ANO11243_054090 [fungal sp. No.11243]
MSPNQGQPAWMVELSKNKQQRNSTATFSSQEDVVLETASVKSFQPYKASTAQVTSQVAQRGGSRDVTPTEITKRSFTPPTKAKPAALAGKPSKESLKSKTHAALPTDDESSAVPFEGQQKTAPKTPELSNVDKFGSSIASPQLYDKTDPRSKPGTPSRTDFKANLSSRPQSTEKGSGVAPEFMNALGKLKKTTTQNYVAPDVLKNNILMGKAGLAATGGPQKTQRVDEFKDSILKKKAEMTTKAPAPGPKPGSRTTSAAPTPEALLVKKGLQRSSSSNLSVASPTPKRDITPEALARHKTLRGKPAPAPMDGQRKLSETPTTAPFTTPETRLPDLDFASNAEQQSPPKRESQSPPPSKPIEIESKLPQVLPAKSPSPVKSNPLADRFNPGLAGLLARGPPASSSVSPVREASVTRAESRTIAPPSDSFKDGEDTKPTELTHMTKGRARGPKRRKPMASNQTNATASQPVHAPVSISVSKRPQESSVAGPIQPKPKSAAVRTLSMNLSEQTSDKSKPPTPTKSSTFPMTISSSLPAKNEAARPDVSGSPTPSTNKLRPGPQTSLASITTAQDDRSGTNNGLEENKENTASLPSVKSAAATWGRSEQSKPSPTRGLPIKLPSKQDEDAAMRSAGLLSSSSAKYQSSKPDGLGIATTSSDSPKSSKYPISPPASGGMPPKPGKSSRVVSQTLGDAPSVHVTENGKLVPLPTEREYILFSSSIYIVSHVYGTPSGQRQMEVFLWAGSGVSSAAVEDAQIFAKRVAKDTAQGSRSIPPVTQVRQAMEPATFFQALGGIVVIRRGSHADAVTKPYMLCGRPHVGHVAFDEVELSLALLHSIFPYIVVNPRTIQDTQVYLWKGNSCGAEAVGSARLISMDLASSDVIEVVDGAEPANFLALFGPSFKPADSDIPQLVRIGLSDKLVPRMLRFDAMPPRRASPSFFGLFNKRPSADAQRPPSSHRPASSASNKSLSSPPTDDAPTIAVTELAPFSQDDFDAESVYMLDCIASVLVIPGPLLSAPPTTASGPRTPDLSDPTKPWETRLAQACLFAHDYALLAAGLQDRPSVPAVWLVLAADLPESAKRLFRTWDEKRGLWGAAGIMAGRPRVEKRGLVGVQEVMDLCCGR